MKKLKFILDFLEEIIFGLRCAGCDKFGEILCLDCFSTFEKNQKEVLKTVDSIFDYRSGKIKKIIWAMKYKNNKKIAKKLGEILAEYIYEEIESIKKFNTKDFIVVCIPSRANKERIFNHSLLLAKEVAQKNNLEFIDCLYFERKTEKQASIKNKRDRFENMNKSMSVKKYALDKIYDKNIILIDDIITTGSTINEASRVLNKANAKKIFAYTLAH